MCTHSPGPDIGPLDRGTEAEACARIMADTDPWLTLGFGFESLLRTLHDPGIDSFVARVEGAPAGIVSVMMKGAFTGYVCALAVDARQRGRGIGAQLLAFAEEQILRHRPNVFLCVSSFNTDAQRFYMREGYERIGEIADYFVRGHSEYIMRKTAGPWSEFSATASGPRDPGSEGEGP